MGIRLAVALARLLVCGCYSLPPYVNPLTAEQLDGVRISEIWIEHLQDGSNDAEKAAKFAPGNGNAVLVLQLQRAFGDSRIKTSSGCASQARSWAQSSPRNTRAPTSARRLSWAEA